MAKRIRIDLVKLKKLGAMFQLSQSPKDFFIFFLSVFIFGKGKIKTKLWKEIEVFKGENILTSASFKKLIALSYIYLMKNKGFYIKEEEEGTVIKLNGSEIKINQNDLHHFDLSLEGLYYIVTEKSSTDFKVKFENERLFVEFENIKLTSPKYYPLIYSVYEIFFEEHYSSENIPGTTVIDIGSSIGDSSIYFLRKGAEKVFGYEPQSDLVKIAEENIKINSFEGKAKFINEFFTKDKVRKISDPENTILKLDCEGCEFEIIDEITKSSLKFREIIFEFHKTPIMLFFNLLKKRYKIKEIIFTYPTLGIAKFSV